MTRTADIDVGSLLPLHALEFRILLALVQGRLHGYRIVKQIEAQVSGGRRIFPANLYRRIRNLVGKGLIEEAPAGDVDEAAGERRRYFQLTPTGRRVVEAEARRLHELLGDAVEAGVPVSRSNWA